jgi:hypothetical protein
MGKNPTAGDARLRAATKEILHDGVNLVPNAPGQRTRGWRVLRKRHSLAQLLEGERSGFRRVAAFPVLLLHAMVRGVCKPVAQVHAVEFLSRAQRHGRFMHVHPEIVRRQHHDPQVELEIPTDQHRTFHVPL